MCPARIECQNGHSFILRKGEELNRQSPHFDELTFQEKQDLKGWLSIHGTKKGYKVSEWRLHDTFYFVSPDKVTSLPAGHEKNIQLEEGNVYTLSGGTRVIPIYKGSKK